MTNNHPTRLGLVRCQHCNRQFNPHSAARHIPWCGKQQIDNRRHRPSAEKQEALERYRWRISYRPSNQFNGLKTFNNNNNNNENSKARGEKHSNQRHKTTHAKMTSSANCHSASLSSPSAESTTSIGTSIGSGALEQHQIINATSGCYNSTSSIANGRKMRSGTGRADPAVGLHQANGRTPPAHLKRSVSSLTLTKQHGTIGSASSKSSRSTTNHTNCSNGDGQPSSRPSNRGGHHSRAATDSTPLRAKSVSDLAGMSEIVEILAKKMEKIYAQNKLLLASISSAGLRQSNGTCKGSGSDSDSEGKEEDLCMRCHHCKASCRDDANYCHKCGCKVRAGQTEVSAGCGGYGSGGSGTEDIV